MPNVHDPDEPGNDIGQRLTDLIQELCMAEAEYAVDRAHDEANLLVRPSSSWRYKAKQELVDFLNTLDLRYITD